MPGKILKGLFAQNANPPGILIHTELPSNGLSLNATRSSWLRFAGPEEALWSRRGCTDEDRLLIQRMNQQPARRGLPIGTTRQAGT